jgi:hypothetical protein
MARTITAALEAATLADLVKPVVLVEALFGSGASRMWTGHGDITWNGVTWVGVGTLLGIGQITETREIRATGLDISLSGVPAEMISLALSEPYQGRQAKIYIGAFNNATGALIADPYLAFSGRMDVMVISEKEEPIITVSTESRLIDLERPRERRWDDQDQQTDYPGDKFFEFVSSIQNIEIRWGR